MATNVLSNDIRIFPSSKRDAGTTRYGDNFITEYNLSSVTNKLLYSAGASTNSQNGFLITTNPSSDEIEFNIGGYFITVTKQSILNAINNVDNGGTNYQNFVTFSVSRGVVYAHMRTTPGASTEEAYVCMSGSDNVTAANTATSGTDMRLPIMRVSGSEGTYTFSNLYLESKLRLTNFALDDGEL